MRSAGIPRLAAAFSSPLPSFFGARSEPSQSVRLFPLPAPPLPLPADALPPELLADALPVPLATDVAAGVCEGVLLPSPFPPLLPGPLRPPLPAVVPSAFLEAPPLGLPAFPEPAAATEPPPAPLPPLMGDPPRDTPLSKREMRCGTAASGVAAWVPSSVAPGRADFASTPAAANELLSAGRLDPAEGRSAAAELLPMAESAVADAASTKNSPPADAAGDTTPMLRMALTTAGASWETAAGGACAAGIGKLSVAAAG